MPISAGDIQATMTLDTAQFSSGVAKARSELTVLEAGGGKTASAITLLEKRMGASSAAIAAQMQGAGQSAASLMEAMGRADGAVAKVDALAEKAARAAEALNGAQVAAQQAAARLALLEESAEASAENLRAAREELNALRESGSASAAALSEAEKATARFDGEAEKLAEKIRSARQEYEQSTAAVGAAQGDYRKLAAQLLTAEGAAEKANGRLAQLTQTLQSGGEFSIAGLINTLTSLGSSTLTSASRSLSNMAISAAGLSTGTAAGALATNGLSTALDTLVKTLGGAKLGLVGLGASAIYAGYKLHSAYKESQSGEKLWAEAYAGVPESRTTTMTNIIEAGVELNTEGLTDKVSSVYQEIGDALTDGEPDTEGVISSIQENAEGMFADVRERIQTWYDAEMANLDLSTSAGLAKAEELTSEYYTLMDRVDELDASTGAWIASYAGKSTEECTKALTQLETYEEELERLAQRADELTALLTSNQKAAYTTAVNGLTTDSTTIGNAVAYVQADYSMKLNYATEDYDTTMAELWQEYQEKLQGAANEQEKLEIDAEYEMRLQEANDDYAAKKIWLESEYKRMLADVFQGVAKAAGKSDPQLAEAVQKAMAGDFESLSDLQLDNSDLAATMKALVEAGVLDGITAADLSTSGGQREAMVGLLTRGAQGAVDEAWDKVVWNANTGPFSFLGPVEGNFAQEINRIAGQGLVTPAHLVEFFDAMSYDYAGASGVEYLASFLDVLNAAGSAGNLDAEGLAMYGEIMQDLFAILDAADWANTEKSEEFLRELSAAMNELGYDTDPSNVVSVLQSLYDTWLYLENMDGTEIPVEVDPVIRVNEQGVPMPTEEQLREMGYFDFEPMEIPVEVAMPETAPISAAAALAAATVDGALTAAFGDVDVSDAGRALIDSAASGLDGTEGDFESAGDNAGKAFVSGLDGWLSAAAAAGTAIGSAAYNALRESLDIRSPSRRTRELGAYAGRGFALGISDQIATAENSIRRLAGATLDAAGTTGGHYSNSVNINLYNASIRSDEDIRVLARQMGRYITEVNHGR